MEKSPDDRPSIAEVWSYVEKLKAKDSTISSKESKVKSSEMFSSESKDDDSPDDVASKFSSVQGFFQDVDKNNSIDDPDKNFTGFGTKIAASLTKNGTKGWIIYATENSTLPPRIQYIAKLILKAWRKPDKISKFYNWLMERGFEQNTIIALKTLCLIHKYILWGPPPAEGAREVLVKLYESWAGNIIMKTKTKKDEYRSEFFSQIIWLYSEILIMKYDLYHKHKLMISQNFSLTPFFSNRHKIEGSPLSIKVIRNLFNYWRKITEIHDKITNHSYLRKIVSFIAESFLEEEYQLVSLITHLYRAFKFTAFINKVEYKIEKDIKSFDEMFIRNYWSCLLFYHKVIRNQELEDVRPKLPYFPHKLLKYFKVNSFMHEIDLKNKDKNDIMTFINPSNKILDIELPSGYSSHRFVALSEYHDNYDPFKDYQGGDNVIKDWMHPMPTKDSILQIIPSKNNHK